MIPTATQSPSNLSTAQFWAARLRGLGLSRLTAFFLEAAGPLNLALAQLIHTGQPLLGDELTGNQVARLAGLLEDERQTATLLEELRKPGP